MARKSNTTIVWRGLADGMPCDPELEQVPVPPVPGSKRRRPSFGRSKSERGTDEFDTPPEALRPLFIHEPLLANVSSVCEPAAGRGNLVMQMRLYGCEVFASDISNRGCPGSEVLDFFAMKRRPPRCKTLITNPPYAEAMRFIEHAWTLGFPVVILLLKMTFLNTEERYERMHKTGRLRRVHSFVGRLQDMHDARHLARGGKQAGQSQDHGWYVFDLNYCGRAWINPISIARPLERMPWSSVGDEVGKFQLAAE